MCSTLSCKICVTFSGSASQGGKIGSPNVTSISPRLNKGRKLGYPNFSIVIHIGMTGKLPAIAIKPVPGKNGLVGPPMVNSPSGKIKTDQP